MIISVTGLFGTLGLTFAMSQVLSVTPDRLGEGEIKEHFSQRFRLHSESEPRLQIRPGSMAGKIRVKAWIEPKITTDRNRLGFTLRHFLWGAPYKSGQPESVWVVFRDPVTRKSVERQLFPLETRRAPRPVPKSRTITGKKTRQGPATKDSVGSPAAKPSGIAPAQSLDKDRSGKGFKSQRSSSKTR